MIWGCVGESIGGRVINRVNDVIFRERMFVFQVVCDDNQRSFGRKKRSSRMKPDFSFPSKKNLYEKKTQSNFVVGTLTVTDRKREKKNGMTMERKPRPGERRGKRKERKERKEKREKRGKRKERKEKRKRKTNGETH